MSKSLLVNVTEQEIGSALRANGAMCMIAEAIRRDMPHLRNILVDITSIRWSDPKRGKRVVYFTPGDAALKLVAFDQGEDVKPFVLKLSARPAQVTDMQTRKVSADGRQTRVSPTRVKTLALDGLEQGCVSVRGGAPPAVGILAGGTDGGGLKRAVKRGVIRKHGLCLTGKSE